MATKKSEGTVKTKDFKAVPENYFSTMDLEQLHAVADYFGAEQEETVAEQVLALSEMGVTYKLYAQAFKVPLPEDYTEVVDEPEVKEEPSVSEPVLGERSPTLVPQQEYLIKMTRQNPYFEVGKYKFTKEHPYNIMDAVSAQHVLSHEEGFRQAFPDELREFYDND